MSTFNNVLVTGNQTIQQDLQVNGNQTIGQSLQVNQNQTIAGSLQVNSSETILNHLAVGGSASVGQNANVTGVVTAGQRLVASNMPSVPAGGSVAQQVRFYATSILGQPGLVLKGTDGFDYVIFIDNSGGSVNIGIQRL